MKKYFLSSVVYMLLGLIVLLRGEDMTNMTMVYERENGHIWVNFYKKDIKTQYLGDGYHPQISPRGDKVAFTLDKYPLMSRRIGIIDIKTGEIRILTSIPGNRNYGPVWSPDGRYIAFNYWNRDRWDIGIVNNNDGEFHILTAAESSEIGFFAPTWSPDSNHIFCHNMQYLYKINISGKVVYKQEIYNMISPSTFSVTSSTKFLPSNNNRYMIVDPSDISRFGMKGLDGPVNTIVLYDTITKDARYIVPGNFYAQNPQWLNDSEILFEGVTEKELNIKGNNAPLNIYRLSLNTKTPKLLIKNAKNPSAYCGNTK